MSSVSLDIRKTDRGNSGQQGFLEKQPSGFALFVEASGLPTSSSFLNLPHSPPTQSLANQPAYSHVEGSLLKR